MGWPRTLSAIVALLAESGVEMVFPPAGFTDANHPVLGNECPERTSERAFGYLRSNAAVNVFAKRIREPLEIFENQRPQAVRLHACQRRQIVESSLTQQSWRNKVPCAFRPTSLLDKFPFKQTSEPMSERCRIGKLEALGKLDR
jgi:hypothetical protein